MLIVPPRDCIFSFPVYLVSKPAYSSTKYKLFWIVLFFLQSLCIPLGHSVYIFKHSRETQGFLIWF